MPVSASELLDATCEECVIFEKCLMCRMQDRSGWHRNIDPLTLQVSPYSDGSGDQRKDWTEHFGGTVCPLFLSKKTEAPTKLLDANATLKVIEKWCKEQLKRGGTTKEEFDAQLVKFKAIKESDKAGLVVVDSSQLEQIQSFLVQVFGGISNGNK